MGTEGEFIVSQAPLAGGRAYTNPDGQYAWVSAQPIPVNPQQGYAVRGSLRLSAPGTVGGVYLVVRLLDDEGNDLTGDGTYWFYPVAHHIPSNADWVTFSATFGAGSTRPIPSAARTMAVAAILNSTPDGQAGDRRYEVTGLTVDNPAPYLGGRRIGRVTSCAYTSSTTNPPLWPGHTTQFYWVWRAQDCDNGLPSGTCLGFMSRSTHCGNDEDWWVALPGETLGSGPAPNGGMGWWTGNACAGFSVAAIYMCER